MSKKAWPLLPLQKLDGEILSLKHEREELPKQLFQEEQLVHQIQQEIESAKEHLKQTKMKLAEKELGLKNLEEKIKQLNIKASTVKKNEEYQALMREISSVKADKSVVEDEMLAFYTQIDENEKHQKEQGVTLKQCQGKFTVQKQKIEAEIAQLDTQIKQFETQRSGITQNIDVESLRQYGRIIAAKEDGQALAEVVDSTCQACMVSITSQDLNLLMLGKDLIACRNCSRILYLKPTEQVPA